MITTQQWNWSKTYCTRTCFSCVYVCVCDDFEIGKVRCFENAKKTRAFCVKIFATTFVRGLLESDQTNELCRSPSRGRVRHVSHTYYDLVWALFLLLTASLFLSLLLIIHSLSSSVVYSSLYAVHVLYVITKITQYTFTAQFVTNDSKVHCIKLSFAE